MTVAARTDEDIQRDILAELKWDTRVHAYFYRRYIFVS